MPERSSILSNHEVPAELQCAEAWPKGGLAALLMAHDLQFLPNCLPTLPPPTETTIPMDPAGNLRKDIQVTLRRQNLTVWQRTFLNRHPHPTSNDPANLRRTSSTAALILQLKQENPRQLTSSSGGQGHQACYQLTLRDSELQMDR